MKISELTTKEFLSNPGAVANSYVLINYEDNTTEAPVTYKATVDELGKAIANNLQLYKADSSGNAYTMGVSQGAYTNNTAKQFVTAAEKTKIANALTQHQDISGKVDKVTGKGLSTNDYTDADKLKVTNAISGSMASIAESVSKETIVETDAYNTAFNLNYALYEEDADRFWIYKGGEVGYTPVTGLTTRIADEMMSMTMEFDDQDYQMVIVDSQGNLGYIGEADGSSSPEFKSISIGGGSGSGSGSSAPPSNCFYVYDPPEGQEDDHLPLELRRSGAASKYLANELVQDIMSLTVNQVSISAMFVIQDSDGQFYGYTSGSCGATELGPINLPVPYEKVVKHGHEVADSVYSCVFYASYGCYSCLMTLDEHGNEFPVPPSVYESNGSLMQPLYVTATTDELGYFDEYGDFNEFTISVDKPITYPLAQNPQVPSVITNYDYVFACGDGANKQFYIIEDSGVPSARLIGTPLFYTKDTINNKLLLKDPDGQTIGQVDLIVQESEPSTP